MSTTEERLERLRWFRRISGAYKYTNLSVAFLAGVGVGYTQEKAGQPYSAADVGLQLGVPAALQAVEYLTLDKVLRIKGMWREGKEEELISKINNSNLGGVGTFFVGDYLGRGLAKLL